MITPPSDFVKEDYPKLKEHQFTIKQPSDVVVSGLGWIAVHELNTKIAMWAPEGIDVFVRKAII